MDLSYLELEGQGRGIIMEVTHLLLLEPFYYTSVIYQADVYAEDTVMTYYGLTENEFKTRCSKHKSSFRDKNRNQTSLSSYIWKLKDIEIPYVVDWSIKARGHPFSSGGRSCDLCLHAVSDYKKRSYKKQR